MLQSVVHTKSQPRFLYEPYSLGVLPQQHLSNISLGGLTPPSVATNDPSKDPAILAAIKGAPEEGCSD